MSSQPKQTIYLETSVISAYFDFWERSPEQKQATQKFLPVLVKPIDFLE